MRMLMIGDIMGSGALDFLEANLPRIRREQSVDFCIANGENTAPDGLGITREAADVLYRCGVDVITLGNHFRSKRKDVEECFDDQLPIIRPHNIESSVGRGYLLYDLLRVQIGVINLSGRVFMSLPAENPFTAADALIEELQRETPLIFVDFHAEATSEKNAMLQHLKGKVSGVFGTHTHVQTADERIEDGTAYITDVGLTGPRPSVLGMDPSLALRRFLTDTNDKLSVAEGNIQLNAVLVDTDEKTGKSKSISRFNIETRVK